MVDLEDTEWFVLKCEPDYALDLREKYTDIKGAWHMNKKHWNQLSLTGALPDSLVRRLIIHSYNEVVKKLTKRTRMEMGISIMKETE